MGVKLIAVGNRLMGDEGIAIKLAEDLESEFFLQGIEVIIGETDMDYCFENIETEDFILVLDASCYGIEPGSITITPIDKNSLYLSHSLTQHDLSLVKMLKGPEDRINGFLIGIEVGKIDFSLNLSSILSDKYPAICENIKKTVLELKMRPEEEGLALTSNKP